MDYAIYGGRGIHKVTGEPRPIRYLPNVSEWADRIYQLEAAENNYSADKVLGGTYGVTNAPIQALTNRTNYLKDHISQLTTFVTALYELLTKLNGGIVTIKTFSVHPVKPDDPTPYAWVNIGKHIDEPTTVVKFSNGVSVTNPFLTIDLPTLGRRIVRTDGLPGELPFIDNNAFND